MVAGLISKRTLERLIPGQIPDHRGINRDEKMWMWSTGNTIQELVVKERIAEEQN